MEKLYNIAQTAKLLTVHEATVRAWVFQCRLPVLRLGRAVRVKESVIERVLTGGLEAVAGGAEQTS